MALSLSVMNLINRRDANRNTFAGMLKKMGHPKPAGSNLTSADITKLMNSPYESIVKTSILTTIASEVTNRLQLEGIINQNMQDESWLSQMLACQLLKAKDTDKAIAIVDFNPSPHSKLLPQADLSSLLRKLNALEEENLNITIQVNQLKSEFDEQANNIFEQEVKHSEQLSNAMAKFNQNLNAKDQIRLNPQQIDYLPEFLTEYKNASKPTEQAKLLAKFENRGKVVNAEDYQNGNYQFGAFKEKLADIVNDPKLNDLSEKVLAKRAEQEKALYGTANKIFSLLRKQHDNNEEIKNIDSMVQEMGLNSQNSNFMPKAPRPQNFQRSWMGQHSAYAEEEEAALNKQTTLTYAKTMIARG